MSNLITIASLVSEIRLAMERQTDTQTDLVYLKLFQSLYFFSFFTKNKQTKNAKQKQNKQKTLSELVLEKQNIFAIYIIISKKLTLSFLYIQISAFLIKTS